MSRKHAYLALLMRQPIDWLRASAASPTRCMTPMHIALHHVATRRKTGARAVRRPS